MNDQINSVNTSTTNSNYTPSGSTTACPVPQACGSRLPCGLCLITNQRCSMMPWRPSITWTNNTVTTSTDIQKENKNE